MKYTIVFIDDQMYEGKDDAFVRAIRKLMEKEDEIETEVFCDPQKGLDYVSDHINSKMIVFLDCKFDQYKLQGHDVLKKIRERTSLLFVVMMSVNSLNQMPNTEVADMINEDYICFVDRNNCKSEDACCVIDKIKQLWSVRFDCILESWIIDHPEYADKFVFSEAGGKSYTWSDVLHELHHQTPIVKSFQGMMNRFFIYQFDGSEK